MATVRCGGMNFENIQAVLFDKDGTLANVERYLSLLGQLRAGYVAACVEGEVCSSASLILEPQLLAAFGQGDGWIDPSGLMAVGSREYTEVAAAAYVVATGKFGWGAALARVKAAFCKADEDLPLKVTQTKPLEGTFQLFSGLATADVTLGIVSSDVHREVEAFVEYYNCKDISWYCGASPDQLPKTHPDFLNFACESMGVRPGSTLVVGDSASDLVLAQQGAAGFVAMLGGWSCLPVIEGLALGECDAEQPSVLKDAGLDGVKVCGSVPSEQSVCCEDDGCQGADLRMAAIFALDAVEVFK